MCFSAQVSLATGTALVACGALTVPAARQVGARYLSLACLPVFFGLQQISEGIVWLSIDQPTAGPSIPAALFFLFFAYCFWPFWVPMSSALIEPDPARRRVFAALAGIGLCIGMGLYLPALFHPQDFDIYVIKHSIQYENSTLVSGEAARIVTRIAYATIICIPLIGSTHPRMPGFGHLILGSVVVGFLVGSYAFTSIWCFLAACISAYIWVILRALKSGPQAMRDMGQGQAPPT